MGGRQLRPASLALCAALEFMGRSQSEVAAGQLQILAAGQAAEQGHIESFQHLRQQLPVAGAADAIQHHTRQLQIRVVVAEAAHQGAEGGGLATGIDHQQHRQTQQPCGGGGAARFAAADAIEQPHHPFHERMIGGAAVAAKGSAHP